MRATAKKGRKGKKMANWEMGIGNGKLGNGKEWKGKDEGRTKFVSD